MDVTLILDQINRAVDAWDNVKAQYPNLRDVPPELGTQCYAQLASTLRRLAPPGSSYEESAALAFTRPGDVEYASILVGVLIALRKDYEAGYLRSVQELVHSAVFSDFLEMASHLLGEGYKDPAAVLAGGVLEEHLRKLCEKNSLPTEDAGRPKKADTLNADLARAGVISKADQKSVTAWLDLRNSAAHGKYDDYTKEQVALLIQSIRDFITRVPA